MYRKNTQHNIGAVFVLLMFAVLAACVMAVLLTGAKSYKSIVERDKQRFDSRACLAYIETNLRAADSAGCVSVGGFDGGGAEEGDTLHLSEEIDGERYETRIYCFGGYLRELFTQEGADFEPEDGEKVLASKGLELSLDSDAGLLTVTVTGGEGCGTETLRIRSGNS